MKTVGLVISHKNNEKRRALLPEDLDKIKHLDYLFFEKGYGDSIGLKDSDYKGANFVSREEALKCDVIVDVKLGDADYLNELDDNKILCGWAHAVQNLDFTTTAVQKKNTVIAWEKALICREAVIKSVGIMMGIEDHQEKNIIRRLL